MRHIKIVHEKQKFKCNSCDDAFNSRTGLKYHFQLKHEDITEHKCDRCGKTYTLLRYLKRHIKYSHENPPKKSKCNLCNAEFVYLKRHMKTCVRSIHGESNQAM